jgi:hypothetical protein
LDSTTTTTSTNPDSSSRSSIDTPSAELDELDDDHLNEEDLAASSGRSSYRSTRSIREINLVPSEAVLDLRGIAEWMALLLLCCSSPEKDTYDNLGLAEATLMALLGWPNHPIFFKNFIYFFISLFYIYLLNINNILLFYIK